MIKKVMDIRQVTPNSWNIEVFYTDSRLRDTKRSIFKTHCASLDVERMKTRLKAKYKITHAEVQITQLEDQNGQATPNDKGK